MEHVTHGPVAHGAPHAAASTHGAGMAGAHHAEGPGTAGGAGQGSGASHGPDRNPVPKREPTSGPTGGPDAKCCFINQKTCWNLMESVSVQAYITIGEWRDAKVETDGCWKWAAIALAEVGFALTAVIGAVETVVRGALFVVTFPLTFCCLDDSEAGTADRAYTERPHLYADIAKAGTKNSGLATLYSLKNVFYANLKCNTNVMND